MPTKQYCDYIAERQARKERIEQQFPYERIEQEPKSFWMHSIERKENAGELEKVVAFAVSFVILILCLVLYFGSK